MSDPADVPQSVRDLLAALAVPQPMRRGSLSERYMRCNKPGCPCTEREEARHGPYFSLTRAVGQRTQSRLVSAEQAAVVRAQVAAGQQFRKQIDAYWEACEQWADAHLVAPEAASQEAAKKGGAKRPSRPRASPRSKRS